MEELPPIDLEGTSPLELALPIPTQASLPVESAYEEDPGTGADAEPVDETEETAAEADKTHPAPVETIVAEQETEPQPSAV